MIRFTEIVLLLLPLAAFAAWRCFGNDRPPTWHALCAAASVLALSACALIWLRIHDAAPPERVYVPSHMEGGRIVDAPAKR